jgi:hypothetical protein
MAGVVVVAAVVTLAACGKSADQKEYADDAFYVSLKKGLQARWKITDKQEKNRETVDADGYASLFSAELKHIDKYPNKSFKSKKLKRLAKDYVAALKHQQSLLTKYDENSLSYNVEFQKASLGRIEALGKINKYKKLNFTEKGDKKNWNSIFKGQAPIKDYINTYDLMDNQLKKGKLVLAEGDSSYKTYHLLLDNTTSHAFSYFTIDVKLIDKNGVTVSTQSTTTENWDKGSKVQFDIGTDKTFATYKLTINRYNYK